MCEKRRRLRALVSERLSAAAEEIFALVETTIAEYEEELRRSREENQRNQRLLDSALRPQVRLHRTADVQIQTERRGEQAAVKDETSPEVKTVTVKTEDCDSGEEGAELQPGHAEGEGPRGANHTALTLHQNTAVQSANGIQNITVSDRNDGEKTSKSSVNKRKHVHIKTERTGTGRSLDLSNPRSLVPPQTHLREESEEPEDWSQAGEPQTGEPQAGGSAQLLHSDEETDECNKVHDMSMSMEMSRTTKTSAKCDGEGKRKHECPICQKKLGRKQELKRHMLLHTGEKPFSCPVCEKRFIQKSNLKSHIVTHLDSVDTIIRHQKASEVSREEMEGEERGGAEEEQRRGAEEEEWRGAEEDKLMDHLSDSDNEEDWPQMMEGPCSSSAQQEEGDGSTLERLSFLLNQALNESKERGQTTVYQCPICDKVFGRMENLRRHILVHTGEKAFSCPVCNKQFTLKQHLKLHMVLHTRDKQFSCSVCSKTFIRKDNLRSHMRIHSADRPFGCSECGARFFSDQDLERHKTVHTAERPFVCSVCNSSFLTRRHLTRHEKIHKKETQKPD